MDVHPSKNCINRYWSIALSFFNSHGLWDGLRHKGSWSELQVCWWHPHFYRFLSHLFSSCLFPRVSWLCIPSHQTWNMLEPYGTLWNHVIWRHIIIYSNHILNTLKPYQYHKAIRFFDHPLLDRSPFGSKPALEELQLVGVLWKASFFGKHRG